MTANAARSLATAMPAGAARARFERRAWILDEALQRCSGTQVPPPEGMDTGGVTAVGAAHDALPVYCSFGGIDRHRLPVLAPPMAAWMIPC